jgi:hypothetical protein
MPLQGLLCVAAAARPESRKIMAKPMLDRNFASKQSIPTDR